MPPADGEQTPKPIIPATGEELLAQPDYTGQGADTLSLVRHFRSSWAGNTARDLPVDPGLTRAWSHNHAVSLKQEGTAGTAGNIARVIFGDGSVRAFGWEVGSNSWSAGNSADTLIANSTGLLYKRLDDDSQWQFDTAGKLLTVTQRNGWVTTYTYSTTPVAGLLLTVSNHFGRTLSFAYNASSQLTSVTASDGQVTSYTYDGITATSHLISVSYPGNSGGTVTRTYHYENTTFTQLVTGITDERGIRLATIAYDSQGRATSSGYAGGADQYSVSYGTNAATVTDPLGTARTYNYSTNKGKLAVTGSDKPSGTGAASAASRVQDANGFITQETDFLGVNTMYTWDINRRLPLTTTKASGLPEVQTTSTQWHTTFRLPVLVTEAGRTTAYTYDAQGNLLSRTETDTASNTSRTTSWTYNSLRLPTTQTAFGGIVTSTYAYYAETTFPTVDPNAGDPRIQSVSLLLHGDGANGSTSIIDSSLMPNTVTAMGTPQISTSQSKFGGASIRFDGGIGYLTGPYQASLNAGMDDFTAETWYYTLSATSDQAIFTIGKPAIAVGADVAMGLHHFGSTFAGKVRAFVYSGADQYFVDSIIALTTNAWHHLAFVKRGGLLSLYLNGVLQGTATANVQLNTSTSGWVFSLGRYADSAPRYVNGYLDDFRFTKGVARYVANFTPPSQAFADVADPPIDPNAMGHNIGDLQSITNAAGHITQFTQYDRAGRVRQMVDPKGIVTDTAYTPRGWTASTTVTPPGGVARTTAYAYDNAGQLTGVTLPDSTTMSYSYDAAHRLTGVTDAKGNTVSYTLDGMGNKTGEQVKDPQGNLQRNITRVYDVLNRIHQTTGASN
ncbi:LamG-like jellyroll fold domain-containing protein [Polaromonas sp.]|uniref:LamG-like jellyroll fold domain-containing protein n=1 Tax=Polaromonas sp. TaxID=1869339 RepID=UPI003264BBA3